MGNRRGRSFFGRGPRGLDFNRRRDKKRISDPKPVIIIVSQILGVIVLGFLVAFLFFTKVEISGVSMSPTLVNGEQVLLNRAGLLTKLKARDVVAFRPGKGGSSQISVKRIMAVPGDSVLIENGSLYVNGKKESTDLPEMVDAGVARSEILLGEGEYFLLGDNRNNSEDSRFASVGNIKKSDIIGIVWLYFGSKGFGLVG